MDIKEILTWILRIFIVGPWWLKIIMIAVALWLISIIGKVIFYIPSRIINNIAETEERKAKDKLDKEISDLISESPQSAMDRIEQYKSKNKITEQQYLSYLDIIARRTEDIEAISKLYKIYLEKSKVSKSGEENKENDRKLSFWREYLAKAGDMDAIIEHYGISDFNISSRKYDEIFSALDKVTNYEKNKYSVSHIKGLIYYKSENISDAKKEFENSDSDSLISKFMLLKCALKENDMASTEELIEKLEDLRYIIPADIYLTMYEYYQSKNDIQQEIKYVDKYKKCRDCDAKILSEKCSVSYYKYAESLRLGEHGLEKDEEKAELFYEKAAELGSKEALFCLGKNLWMGKPNRNYRKAVDYLLQSARLDCPEAISFIEQYGIDGILIKPVVAEKTEYEFLEGYKLVASSDTTKWLYMFSGVKNKRLGVVNAFKKAYTENFKSFDQLVNHIHGLYAEAISMMLQWSVKLLVSLGIDEYSALDIENECDDLDLLSHVPYFVSELERIDNRARQLNADLHYAQLSRRAWSGAGYGTTIGGTIKATIKANVAAEAMNIGGSVLHGIGDSIVKSMNNKELAGMSSKVFSNPKTMQEFVDAVSSACMEIGLTTLDIIEEHTDLELSLEGEIIYEGQNLCSIRDDALENKIVNNLSIHNYKYCYALMVESLRRSPLDYDIINQIVLLTISMLKDGEDKDKIFKILPCYLSYIADFDLGNDKLLAMLSELEC